MKGRTASTNRRRYMYSENDQRRWLTIGALLIASAATLGYVYGLYSEKRKKNGINRAFPLNESNKTTDSDNKSNIKDDIKHNDYDTIKYKRDYNILIYGDNTSWGFDPDTQNRLEPNERYPYILHKLLNSNANNTYQMEVICEALNGRTINHEDLDGNLQNERRKLSMNGTEQILPILYSHKPIDIVIIMLGINDCKSVFHPSANKISSAMNQLISACVSAEIWPIQEEVVSHGPIIILITPPFIRQINEINKNWMFTNASINISQSLQTQYAKIKDKYAANMVHFINANNYIQTSEADYVHIDAQNNLKLANVLCRKIIDIVRKLQRKPRKFSVPSVTSAKIKLHKVIQVQDDDVSYGGDGEEEDSDDDSVISELEQPELPHVNSDTY